MTVIPEKEYKVQATCPACGARCEEICHDYGWELKRVPFECENCHTKFVASVPTDRPRIVAMWENGEDI